MTKLVFIGLLVIGLLGAIILLQIYLSKRENKWLGLILPILSFICSLGFFVPIFITNGYEIWLGITLFVFINIITLIYLGIYVLLRLRSRGNESNSKEVEKMSIKDL